MVKLEFQFAHLFNFFSYLVKELNSPKAEKNMILCGHFSITKLLCLLTICLCLLSTTINLLFFSGSSNRINHFNWSMMLNLRFLMWGFKINYLLFLRKSGANLKYHSLKPHWNLGSSWIYEDFSFCLWSSSMKKQLHFLSIIEINRYRNIQKIC